MCESFSGDWVLCHLRTFYDEQSAFLLMRHIHGVYEMNSTWHNTALEKPKVLGHLYHHPLQMKKKKKDLKCRRKPSNHQLLCNRKWQIFHGTSMKMMPTLEIMTFRPSGEQKFYLKKRKQCDLWGEGYPDIFLFLLFYFLKKSQIFNQKTLHFCQIHPCDAFIHVRKGPVFTLIPTSFPEALVKF